MDVKVYYRKLREAEAAIPDAEVVVVSEETPDGGNPGVRTEVQRAVAARMIVEGRARVATADEAAEYREQAAEAKRMADQKAAADRLQITVLSEADLKALRAPAKQGRDQGGI